MEQVLPGIKVEEIGRGEKGGGTNNIYTCK
jgi:hypothetical protein